MTQEMDVAKGYAMPSKDHSGRVITEFHLNEDINVISFILGSTIELRDSETNTARTIELSNSQYMHDVLHGHINIPHCIYFWSRAYGYVGDNDKVGVASLRDHSMIEKIKCLDPNNIETKVSIPVTKEEAQYMKKKRVMFKGNVKVCTQKVLVKIKNYRTLALL